MRFKQARAFRKAARTLRLSCVTLCVLGSATALGAGKPTPTPARVLACQGATTRAQPNAAWEPVEADRPLISGAMLKTDATPCELTLTDDTAIVLERSSVVQVQAATEVNLEPGPTTRVSRLDLKQGSIRVQIPAKARPLLVMVGKDIFAAFRPGRGRAKVVPDGVLAVVDEGSARVAAGGKWTPLAANQYVVLRAHGAQTAPKSIPPPPVFASEPCRAVAGKTCAIALVSGSAAVPVGVHWLSAPVHMWIVRLARDPNMLSVIATREQPPDQTEFVSEPLPVGRYWLGVQPLTEEGIEGATSIRALRVVRLLADPGVEYLPNLQLFVLPPGRKVKLDGAAGLQVAWGASGFVPAPPAFGLVGDEPGRTVRVRVEGDATDETTVTLERRALRAEVDMSPKTATWPRDPVTVTVKLVDPKHRVSLSSFHPTLRMTLNNTPQNATLTRQGDVWRTRVAPRLGNGPWVIRADVLDSDGNVLGRGMLEVVGPRRSGDRHLLW